MSQQPRQQLPFPTSQSPPPAPPHARPPPALRFGLIFVLLSFCASPCAVIYNLPLLSGLTGSSGVTALAARTASTPQSQQHDGTPQSGNALGSPARRGARGTRRTEPAEEKQKSKLALAFRVLINKGSVFAKNTYLFLKRVFIPWTSHPAWTKRKAKKHFCDLVSGLCIFVFTSLTFGLVFEFG